MGKLIIDYIESNIDEYIPFVSDEEIGIKNIKIQQISFKKNYILNYIYNARLYLAYAGDIEINTTVFL